MNANGIKKCSVIGCDSDSSRNNSLSFQMFPSIKHIALKWLKKLEHLIASSSFEPVQKLYICEKHFESRFLLNPGKIAGNAYPTLFTSNEITTGVPENIENGEFQAIMDHNYCILKKSISNHNYLTQETPNSRNTDNISNNLITENVSNLNTTKDTNDAEHTGIVAKTIKTYSKTPAKSGIKNITNTQHNLVSHGKKKKIKTIQDLKDSNGLPIFRRIAPSPKVIKQVPQPLYTITLGESTNKPTLTKLGAQTNVYSNNIDTAMDFDNNTAMNHNTITNVNNQQTKDTAKFISVPKTTLKMAHSVMKQPESFKILERKYKESLLQVKKLKKIIHYKNERLKRLKFDKKTWFDKLTKHVDNPLAKKFIWMQVRSAPKTSHGRRFTDEEKTICIYIKKQSPECYRILSKIFALPSKNSLYKYLKTEMAPKNKADSSPSYLLIFFLLKPLRNRYLNPKIKYLRKVIL